MAALCDFLGMGGYAAFVWPAYALAAVVLLGLLGTTLCSLRRRERELAALRAARRGLPEDPE